MYKIIIVDDEVLVRIGIKSCIDWQKNGFEIVGEASNGIEALEKSLALKPDIVLTDIRMPKMDGLEFLSQLKEKLPEVKSIILSSYNEFEYVKAAMKIGTLDYILKLSMQPEELINILNGIKVELDKIKLDKEEAQFLKSKANISTMVLKKQAILNALQSSTLDKKSFIDELNSLNVRICFSKYSILHIIIDEYEDILDRKWKGEEERLIFSVINIASEVLGTLGLAEIIEMKKGVFLGILSEDRVDEKDQFELNVAHLTLKLIEMMKQYLNVEISIGISSIGNNFAEFLEKTEEATRAGVVGFYSLKGSIIKYEDCKWFEKDGNESIKIDDRQISRLIETNSIREIKIIIDKVIDYSIESKSIEPFELLNNIQDIIYQIARQIKGLELPASMAYSSNIEYLSKRLKSLANVYTLKEWLNNFFNVLEKIMDEHIRMSCRDEIVKIKKYIFENFRNDISISQCAKMCNMSAKYFSFLFKKEADENFVDFVNRVRVEKAKELLLDTRLMMYEIAERVGYANDKYFSKLFSRMVGMTPIEYRKKKLRNDKIIKP